MIMTGDEIAAYNRAILDTSATKTYDLEALDPTYNGRSMADSMAAFSSPSGLYIDGQPVEESYYEAIRENIRSVLRANGTTWLDNLTHAVVIE